MRPTLHIVFGPQGAGKSDYTRDLARSEPAVAFSIDDWMGRLFAPDMSKDPDLDWVMERVERCEALIWSLAAQTMAAGRSVVLELGLMRRADRERVAEIAAACELPTQFHYLTAPEATRRTRVLERGRIHGEGLALQVTPEMFDFMEGVFEPPQADELARCKVVEGG